MTYMATGILVNIGSGNSLPIQENAFENVAWKMAAILSRPQFVNSLQSDRAGSSTAQVQLL